MPLSDMPADPHDQLVVPDGIVLLATVCNTTRNAAPYALWFARGPEQYLVDLTDLVNEGADHGLTGLAYYDGQLFVAVQSSRAPRILVFDNHMNCTETIMHPEFSDIHSLSVVHGDLIVISTGNRSVVRLDVKRKTTSTLFSTDAKIHVNSAIVENDGLLICCGGSGNLLAAATRGSVIDVTHQDVVVTGLGRPHSLARSGGDFIVLDSLGERIIRFDRNGIIQEQALAGFLRGAATGAGCMFVAGSASRIVSRKNPVAVSTRISWETFSERVCIYELDDKTLTVRRKHFPIVAGFEMYELLVLEDADAFDPRQERLLVPDPYTMSRMFYEAAKYAAAERPE